MASLRLTNIRILDGSGAAPFAGDVVIEGERIKHVVPAAARSRADGGPGGGGYVVDGHGATLMPGLVESHAHLTFIDIVNGTDLGRTPPEEHTLQTARNARVLLEHGFTACFSAASAKPRLDIAVRRAIDAGDVPGPRLRTAGPEMTVTGGLGDARQRHIHQDTYAVMCDGPQAFRRVARTLIREGVDTLKINPSGDTFVPHSRSAQTVMTAAEVAAVCDEAHAHGLQVAAHARSAASIKLALRHGVAVLYHANFADAEALDLLEAAKERVFVAPTIGATLATLQRSPDFGRAQARGDLDRLRQELDGATETARELQRRGVRVLPGGDYGFAWNPNGANARDLQHFVELLGFTPMQAIVAATKLGGELMRQGDELGQIKPGYLADLLLVDGDPLGDIAILQDAQRLRGIMKNGAWFKAPPNGVGSC